MESDEDEPFSSLELQEARKPTSLNALPMRSRQQYECVYKTFMDWKNENRHEQFSESVLLTYFGELAKKYKSSSLWSRYSMLRSTLSINNDVNIDTYTKLRAFLKRKAVGFQPQKAKTFTSEEVNQFIEGAPDEHYLAIKVVLIMGLMGACRTNEMHAMKIDDVQDLKTVFLVRIPVTDTRTRKLRTFTITGDYYRIIKKYLNLRPPNAPCDSFFINYHQGRCTNQRIGVNKLASMGKQIAKYLQLPDANKYTGHSFRKSSASVLVDSTVNITTLRGQEITCKPTVIDDVYFDRNKVEMATNDVFGSAQGSSSSNASMTSKNCSYIHCR